MHGRAGMPTMMSFINDVDDESAEWSLPQAISVLGESPSLLVEMYLDPDSDELAKLDLAGSPSHPDHQRADDSRDADSQRESNEKG